MNEEQQATQYQPPKLEDVEHAAGRYRAQFETVADELRHTAIEVQVSAAHSLQRIAAALEAREPAEPAQGDLPASVRVPAYETVRSMTRLLEGKAHRTRTVQDTVDGDPSVGTGRMILPCTILDDAAREAFLAGLDSLSDLLDPEAGLNA